MRVLAVELFLLYCFGESHEGQAADVAFITLHKLIKKMGNFRFDTAFIFLFSPIVSASEDAAFHRLEIKKVSE